MGISTYFDWQLGRSGIQQGRRTNTHKTHRYNHCQLGSEFFLEQNAAIPISYMTAQGGRVRQGDYIDIDMPTGHLTFQVNEIEYYSDPADMWMAQLHQVAA